MNYILNIVQIVLSILLIILILLQQRGAGLGGTFGGSGEGGVYYKKRGAEKIIFTSTIVLAVLFILTAFVRMLIK